MSSIYPDGSAGGALPQNPNQSDVRGQVAQARDKLDEAGSALKGEAAHFAERAGEQVADKVEEKASEVADALGVFADAIRQAGDELNRQDQTFAAQLAGQAADGLQSLTRTLAGKSPEQMLQSARDLGRTNPTAFVAGAVLAGLAIGRFARSSAHHEASQRATGPAGFGEAGSQQDQVGAENMGLLEPETLPSEAVGRETQ